MKKIASKEHANDTSNILPKIILQLCRWVGHQTIRLIRVISIVLVGCGRSFVSVACPKGVQLVFLFAQDWLLEWDFRSEWHHFPIIAFFYPGWMN